MPSVGPAVVVTVSYKNLSLLFSIRALVRCAGMIVDGGVSLQETLQEPGLEDATPFVGDIVEMGLERLESMEVTEVTERLESD